MASSLRILSAWSRHSSAQDSVTDMMKNTIRTVIRRTVPDQYRRWKIRKLRSDRSEFELQLLPGLLTAGRKSIDVGAADGLYVAHLLGTSEKVIAFEPRPDSVRELRDIFAGHGSKVQIEPVALSNACGSAQIRILTRDPGRSTIESDNGLVDRDGSPMTSVEVPVRVLDDYEFSGVGFIKIDVEGHELPVLQGAARTIVREQPVMLIESEDRHKPGAVASLVGFFDAIDYRGFFVAEGKLVDIKEFEPAVHQNPNNIGGWKDDWKRYGPYVNNFYFLPQDQAGSIENAMKKMLS
jgi:FkbM family methyltransferase